MVEESRPWPGDIGLGAPGDAGPYSDDDWDDIWEVLYGSGGPALSPYNNRGVIRNWDNELVVTSPAANTARVAPGAALVHGKFYKNDADVDINIPTPDVNTRIDRIVLRSSWAAQTIRVTRIAGVEGGGAPAITQEDNVTWDIPLAQVSITTVPAITITDEREFVYDLMTEAPQCRVRRTTNQSIPDLASTAIIFDSARFDNDNIWSVADPTRLICRTPGLYHIWGNLNWDGNAVGYRQTSISLNGIGFRIGSVCVTAVAITDILQIATSLWRMAVGDRVELVAFQNSGAPLNALAVTDFSIEFGMVRVG